MRCLLCCLCLLITIREGRLSASKSLICLSIKNTLRQCCISRCLLIYRKLRVYCKEVENFIFLWFDINLFFTNQNWINFCWFLGILISVFDLTLTQISTEWLQWMLLISHHSISIFVLFIYRKGCCDDRRLNTLNRFWALSSGKSRLFPQWWR